MSSSESLMVSLIRYIIIHGLCINFKGPITWRGKDRREVNRLEVVEIFTRGHNPKCMGMFGLRKKVSAHEIPRVLT